MNNPPNKPIAKPPVKISRLPPDAAAAMKVLQAQPVAAEEDRIDASIVLLLS